jgi:hypothetical protein
MRSIFALARHHNPPTDAGGRGTPQKAPLPAETLTTRPYLEGKRVSMALVPPYHTITPEKPYGERDVYHDRNDCPTGRQIEPQNRRSGTAGRPRCEDCTSLG